jgi:hypothetical protein
VKPSYLSDDRRRLAGRRIVYVHGMRGLNLVIEPAVRAAPPLPKPEEEHAEARGVACDAAQKRLCQLRRCRR